MRDNYLDFLRGLAVISIVLIHTAFWSGRSYASDTFRSLTLIFDVPFFFFLAGWSHSFKLGNVYRSCRGVFYIWIKWLFFITLVMLFCICIGKNDLSLKEFFKNLIIDHPKTTYFPVLGASMWFLPVYFKTIMINTIVLFFIKWYAKKSNKLITLTNIYIYIILLSIVLLTLKSNMLLIDRTLLFYSFFFMLGVSYGLKKSQYMIFRNLIIKLCVIIGLMFFFSYIISFSIFPMQENKSSGTIIYFWYSLITICVAVYCKQFYNKNKTCYINYIGKNAIWYYFSQGISSSILFYIVPFVNLGWILKLSIMFILNLAMALLISEFFLRFYNFVSGVIKNKLFSFIQ